MFVKSGGEAYILGTSKTVAVPDMEKVKIIVSTVYNPDEKKKINFFSRQKYG